MSKKEISKQEQAAQAISEHGFLLQDLVRDRVAESLKGDFPHNWYFEAAEFPVETINGNQNKIDLVLKHWNHQRIKLCIECKSFADQNGFWLFWGKRANIRSVTKPLYLDSLIVKSWGSNGGDRSHEIQQVFENVPIYQFYLAVRSEKIKGKFSNIETIESAIRQAVAGELGMMRHIITTLDDGGLHRSIPVVVTNANLYSAKLTKENIDHLGSSISPEGLELKAERFVITNYAIDRAVVDEEFSSKASSSVDQFMQHRLTRSVFIVNLKELERFLSWANDSLLQTGVR